MTHEGTREDARPSLVAGMAMILARKWPRAGREILRDRVMTSYRLNLLARPPIFLPPARPPSFSFIENGDASAMHVAFDPFQSSRFGPAGCSSLQEPWVTQLVKHHPDQRPPAEIAPAPSRREQGYKPASCTETSRSPAASAGSNCRSRRRRSLAHVHSARAPTPTTVLACEEVVTWASCGHARNPDQGDQLCARDPSHP